MEGSEKSEKNNNGGKKLAIAVFLTALFVLLGGAAVFMKYNKLWGELGIPGLPSGTEAEQEDEQPGSGNTGSDTGTWIEYMDVGQGDCALVCSDGHYMLIDTGDRDSSNTVIDRLEKLGVRKLDYLLLSHPHADHIGEAAEICTQFGIGSVIMPDIPDELLPETVSYDELVAAVDNIEPASDMSFEFGSCTFDIHAPFEYDYDLNNWSMLVRLCCGNRVFLFTGDCEFNEENSFLERGVWLGADVLKVAHHGSEYATSEEWLDAINPTIAVISCGADNDYGHPSEVTVNRLRDHGAEVYITAEEGSIVLETDGETVWKK